MYYYMYPVNAKEYILSYFITMLEYIAETKFLCVAQRDAQCDVTVVWPLTVFFKRLKNREDSSDLDENLTELIAAAQTFIF